MQLNSDLAQVIAAIALGIDQEEASTGEKINSGEIASIVIATSLRMAADYLRETLAMSPDERYGISVFLDGQADLIVKPKE